MLAVFRDVAIAVAFLDFILRTSLWNAHLCTQSLAMTWKMRSRVGARN